MFSLSFSFFEFQKTNGISVDLFCCVPVRRPNVGRSAQSEYHEFTGSTEVAPVNLNVFIYLPTSMRLAVLCLWCCHRRRRRRLRRRRCRDSREAVCHFVHLCTPIFRGGTWHRPCLFSIVSWLFVKRMGISMQVNHIQIKARSDDT